MHPVILVHSGTYFDFTAPETSEYTIEDIAHALSHLCRFTGHVDTFYSVAQHSVLASRIIHPDYAFEALMHDAAEAFLGDVSSPLKAMLPDYKAIEQRIESAVFNKFGVRFPLPPEVKHVDLIMLATEKRDLMPATPDHHWGCIEGIEPLEAPITPWSSEDAYWEFLERFDELKDWS